MENVGGQLGNKLDNIARLIFLLYLRIIYHYRATFIFKGHNMTYELSHPSNHWISNR